MNAVTQRQFRQKYRMTQAVLAELLGYSLAMVKAVESTGKSHRYISKKYAAKLNELISYWNSWRPVND